MNQSTRDSLYDQLTRNTLFLILLPIVGILIGWFGFIRPQFDNVPVTRAEAQSVSGSFEEYEVSKNYRDLVFSDGTSYPVYPHTETAEFQDRMKSLEKGTHLTIAIHPKSGYVIEIRTDTEELLNFETSQQEIYQYGKGYIWIGAFFILASFLVTGIGFYEKAARKKEDMRQRLQRARTKKNAQGRYTPPLRDAEPLGKGKVLLRTKKQGYTIHYRRLKTVNELVVNGKVYDEMKALVEPEHNLCAMIDGHCIEAGQENDFFCYIRFDGETVAMKKRYF